MQATQNEPVSLKGQFYLNWASKEEATRGILRPTPVQEGNAEPWQHFA